MQSDRLPETKQKHRDTLKQLLSLLSDGRCDNVSLCSSPQRQRRMDD